MQIGSFAGSDVNAVKKLQDVSRLSAGVPQHLVDQSRAGAGINVKAQTDNPHNGYAAGVAAETANGSSQNDLAKLAEFTAGKLSLPPAGWRQAGTAQLSTNGIRGDQISSLGGKEFAQIFASGTGENQKLAVQFTKQSGHWQQWLKEGGQQFGPSAAESLAQSKFVAQLSHSTGAEVHVVSEDALLKSGPKSGSNSGLSQSNSPDGPLKWDKADPAAIAFVQDAGRQAHKIAAALF